jgi:hypothetical protein
MQIIQVTATSGADGHLHLDIPTGTADGQFEVTIVRNSGSSEKVSPHMVWLQSCGAIDDDTFDVQRPTDLPHAVVFG